MAPDRSVPRVRPATLQDAPALARIAAGCYVETYEAFAPRAQLAAHADEVFSPERLAEALAEPESRFLVAVVAGEVCGAAQFRQAPAPRSVGAIRPVELATLCTLPERRGRGIGTALMRSVLRTAAEANRVTLWLRVWEGNARAVAFYRRWGFARVATEPDLHSPLPTTTLTSAAVMARPLHTWQPGRHQGWTPLWLEFSHFAPG